MAKDMEIKPLRRDLERFLQEHNLADRWEKTKRLFEGNIRHPSLHVELLEPRWRGIYSFRLDKRYRVLFFIAEKRAEVFQITMHYKKTQ
jgi:Txe/YoeB family toxin of Txe-Axe toxin-antitoxin module